MAFDVMVLTYFSLCLIGFTALNVFAREFFTTLGFHEWNFSLVCLR
jgi:hypothetical protein